ncbi:unnamed protein product [Pieris macdunnoughi]|uniref:Uncharacterized protein n=1 Tax=Pieris macdunnoughi TaxID=345717 RepID=A0A821UK13_9NEOP|nr:unnamed protein product [Pieris macdunnoughi]
MRDTLRAVSEKSSGGLTKVIKTCSELMVTSFFDGYDNIIRVAHVTPYLRALREFYASFHLHPEWFGATNKVMYDLRPYELPSRDRLTRAARGVTLTNSVVGPSRSLGFQAWRVHLARGELLHTLARDLVPSLTLTVMPKLPAPFIVTPGEVNSAQSTIEFGSFTEFHATNVNVEALIDTWLVNDMVHKFIIVGKSVQNDPWR